MPDGTICAEICKEIVVNCEDCSIDCPQDTCIVLGAGLTSTIVNYPPSTSECENIEITYDPPSGSEFSCGTTTVICYATNTVTREIDTCMFDVTVKCEPKECNQEYTSQVLKDVCDNYLILVNEAECIYSVSIPELDSCYSMYIDWGDGRGLQHVPVATSVTHTYSANDTYTVCIQLRLPDGTICEEVCKELVVDCCKCDEEYAIDLLTTVFNGYFNLVNEEECIYEVSVPRLDDCYSMQSVPVATSVTHDYAANGTYEVCLQIRMPDGTICAEICKEIEVTCAKKVECDKTYAAEMAEKILEGYFGRSDGDDCLYKIYSPQLRDCHIAYINWGDGSEPEMIPLGTAIGHKYSEEKAYTVCIEIRLVDGTICYELCKEAIIDCGCPDIVVASDTIRGEKIIEAIDKIATINQIESGAKVRYTAKNAINLNAGFHAKTGSEVSITVGEIFLDCKEEEGILDDTETPLARPIPTEEVLNYGKLETYLSISPNPFRNQAIIDYFVPTDGKVKLILYHINGKVIDQIETTSDEKGWHQLNYQSSNIQPGAYYLILKTEQSLISKKVIIH